MPGPETVTTRTLLALVAAAVGHPVAVRNVPALVLRAMGLVSPLMRGLAEMADEFEEPFILDTAKFESAFGTAATPAHHSDHRHGRLVSRQEQSEHAAVARGWRA